MKTLHDNGFPTPEPIDANRHGILMSYIEGFTFQRIKNLEQSIKEKAYHFLLDLIIRFAEHGLIHSDFNEYNILIDEKEPYNIYVIDFPQMVSMDHQDAKFYFDRDVACIERLFRKKHNFTCERDSQINFDDIKVKKRLDREVKASGYWKWAKIRAKEVVMMENVLERDNDREHESDSDHEEDVVDSEQEYPESSSEEEIAENDEEITENDQTQNSKVEDSEAQTDQQVKENNSPNVKVSTELSSNRQEKISEMIDEHKESPQTKTNLPKTIQKNDEGIEESTNQTEKITENPSLEAEKSQQNEHEEGESEEEQEETYFMTAEEQEKQNEYIKRALKKKFKKKKRFKTNKNKMKAIARLNKDVYL